MRRRKQVAERRMFSKTIIDSDAFLDMPLSSQSLYFHLTMRADDEGFINNPKKIQRMIRASDDDFKLLMVKRFILVFDSGVIVIKHWRMHNYIQSDRYKPTIFQDERKQLTMKENKAYTEILPQIEPLDTECIQDVSKLDTQYRLDKLSIDKNNNISSTSVDSESHIKCNYSEIIALFNQICVSFPKVRELTDKRRKAIKSIQSIVEKHGGFQKLFELAEQSNFLSGRNGQWNGCGFDWLLKPSNTIKVFEGNYNDPAKDGVKNEQYAVSERYGTVL